MATTETLRLYPYFLLDTWVFDDERTGLKEEAFVQGMTEMISRLLSLKGIGGASKGFQLEFGDQPFEGHDAALTWLRPGNMGGDWYTATLGGVVMEGWLCPALTLYFKTAPKQLYVHVDQLPAGIQPIWNPPAGVRTRQFVEAPKRS
ncbi:MAG: hypothetical protein FD129_675 [bacterium]|nr:MAG: hypothetical protein FD129_675 [bacterium]